MNNTFKNLRNLSEDSEKRALELMGSQWKETNNCVFVQSKGYFEQILSSLNITPENVEDFKDFTFISILNTDDIGDNIGYFLENKSNVLVLNFDDVIEDLEFKPGKFAKAITEDQAQKIIEFIEKNKDIIENGKCIVHCSAGVSRSGAVGTFVSDYFGFDYNSFMKRNPNVKPNPLVLRMLKRLTIYKDYI